MTCKYFTGKQNKNVAPETAKQQRLLLGQQVLARL